MIKRVSGAACSYDLKPREPCFQLLNKRHPKVWWAQKSRSKPLLKLRFRALLYVSTIPTLAVCPRGSGHQQHSGQANCTLQRSNTRVNQQPKMSEHKLRTFISVWVSVCVCQSPSEVLSFTLSPSGQHIWGFACSGQLPHSSHSESPTHYLQLHLKITQLPVNDGLRIHRKQAWC